MKTHRVRLLLNPYLKQGEEVFREQPVSIIFGPEECLEHLDVLTQTERYTLVPTCPKLLVLPLAVQSRMEIRPIKLM